MIVLRTTDEVRRALAPHRSHRSRGVVGFVPTMGALHDGHAELIRAAGAASDPVVVSIFVNPTQFTDPADLTAYPRQEDRDVQIAQVAGASYVFAPSVEEMYPDGFATTVDIGGPSRGFEGEYRPGHFQGVATVCVKLFSIVQPDVVFLGQKDAQQVAVLRRVIRDLSLDLVLHVVPTVRAADGLALSSRNARLTDDERRRALAIPRALAAGLEAHGRGGDPVKAARTVLAGLEVEYVEVARFDADPTLVIAARVGRTRLIDNVPLDDPARASLRPAAAAGGTRRD